MIVVHRGLHAPAPDVAQIREAGALAGVSLNPATPVETLAEARYHCDMVLIMSVNPGFGGQSFIETSTDKIRRARAYLPESVTIEVDGGVTEYNAGALTAAGADWLVAGSSVSAATTSRSVSRQWRRLPPRAYNPRLQDQTLLQGGVKVPTGGTAREPREGPTR